MSTLDSTVLPVRDSCAGTPVPAEALLRPTWTRAAVLESMRLRQWVKSGFVLAALIFSGKSVEPDSLARAGLAALIFCGLASSVYLLNDVLDRSFDCRHPSKRHRPVASGELAPAAALSVGVALALASLATGAVLGLTFLLVAALYTLTMVGYCAVLRRIVFVDVLCVSLGFVLRAVAGAAAIGVWISPWLLICTAALSLFLALGKRRNEIHCLGQDAVQHRPVLASYTVRAIDGLIIASAAMCLLAYGLYCMVSITGAQHPLLLASFPCVVSGVGRYLWHVWHRQSGGNPDEIVLGDPWFAANGLVWLLVVLVAGTP